MTFGQFSAKRFFLDWALFCNFCFRPKVKLTVKMTLVFWSKSEKHLHDVVHFLRP